MVPSGVGGVPAAPRALSRNLSSTQPVLPKGRAVPRRGCWLPPPPPGSHAREAVGGCGTLAPSRSGHFPGSSRDASGTPAHPGPGQQGGWGRRSAAPLRGAASPWPGWGQGAGTGPLRPAAGTSGRVPRGRAAPRGGVGGTAPAPGANGRGPDGCPGPARLAAAAGTHRGSRERGRPHSAPAAAAAVAAAAAASPARVNRHLRP